MTLSRKILTRGIALGAGLMLAQFLPFADIASAQTVFFSAGFSRASFSGDDELARPQNRTIVDSGANPVPDDERIDRSFGINLTLEWFFSDSFGIGLKWLQQSGSRSLVIESGEDASLFGNVATEVTYTESIDVTSEFITLNWFPARSSDTVRFGTVLGFGRSAYSYTQAIEKSTEPADSSVACTLFCSSGKEKIFKEKRTAKSPAYLAGAFMDFGNADYGGRLGADYVKNDFDPITTTQVDDNSQKTFDIIGTYVSMYLQFRWGF